MSVELELIVLSSEAYREWSLKWEVLSQPYGRVHAFAKQNCKRATPDVFDLICVDVKEPISCPVLLVEDYEIEKRFFAMSQSYPIFFQVSNWFQFLKTYFPLACAIEEKVFSFIQRSLWLFQDTSYPLFLLFKLSYAFAKLEGLPIEREWLKLHPKSSEFQKLLKQPLEGFNPQTVLFLEELVPLLHQWILEHSEHVTTSFF